MHREDIDALDVPRGHIRPQDAMRKAGQETDVSQNPQEHHSFLGQSSLPSHICFVTMMLVLIPSYVIRIMSRACPLQDAEDIIQVRDVADP